MIFDKPVPDSRVEQGDGPKKYIPGPLLDKKDLTLYQHKDTTMVILDYDQKVDVETMNEVLNKTIDGGALRKGEFVIAVSQKKLNRKMFRNIIDKIIYSQDLRYDYMSSLPDTLHNNVVKFKEKKNLQITSETDIYDSKYKTEKTLSWEFLSLIEQGCIVHEQFYHTDPEIVAGKNIGPDDWIKEHRKVWHIVDRATDEERKEWMKDFYEFKEFYDKFPTAPMITEP